MTEEHDLIENMGVEAVMSRQLIDFLSVDLDSLPLPPSGNKTTEETEKNAA